MAYFAKMIGNTVIDTVLISNQVIDNAEGLDNETQGIDFCKSLFGEETEWKQTSYNTRGGVHYGQNNQPDSGTPIRKNFAQPGMIYDSELDAFYFSNSPHESWIFNRTSCVWEAPVSYPTDEKLYAWDESSTSWVLRVDDFGKRFNDAQDRINEINSKNK